MNDIYVITLDDNADNFDIVQQYFTNKDKAIKWLDSKGFEHLVDDEYARKTGYSINQLAEIQILSNSEEDE
ncbi:hypothetical protein MUA95_09700 [Staphylococcus agnetis]|uniref:Phage protein n=1 Tax=Staphylococcus agnetis TaxID=985762 RepID=A0ABD7TRU0_9STAP|nr:hypothetical protein [Staphylococcus agnetis]UXU56826.1 hypothetical protein MUA95_09700 [Staphylococcus agnetis]